MADMTARAVAHIAYDRPNSLGGKSASRRFQQGLVDVEHADRGAFGREGLCHCKTETPARAGDDHAFSGAATQLNLP